MGTVFSNITVNMKFMFCGESNNYSAIELLKMSWRCEIATLVCLSDMQRDKRILYNLLDTLKLVQLIIGEVYDTIFEGYLTIMTVAIIERVLKCCLFCR